MREGWATQSHHKNPHFWQRLPDVGHPTTFYDPELQSNFGDKF
jgi:hypothetical protein